MRIHLTRKHTHPDLRFQPISRRRRLELARIAVQKAIESEGRVETPDGFPSPQFLSECLDIYAQERRDAWNEGERAVIDRVHVEIIGREIELMENWRWMSAELDPLVARAAVELARYYTDRKLRAIIDRFGAAPHVCGRRCDFGFDDCCCKRNRNDSRSPWGGDCPWCVLGDGKRAICHI